MTESYRLSAAELLAAYGAGSLSPVEALAACAERLESVEPRIAAFQTLCLERAADEAQAAEAAWLRGQARPLEGVPLAVKDLFDSEGVATAYGSRMFAGHVPAADAEAVRRARAAGAILVGKTRTHEFAWGVTSVNEAMGTPRNPWDPARITGGSSGGSAGALAAEVVPLALGSDTGGSIRIPAAFCGVVGLKPTFGLVSLDGCFPLAPSLDHAGPLARTPTDAALLLAALADPVPVPPEPPRLRVGLCAEAGGPVVEAAAAALAGAGLERVEVAFPELADCQATFALLQPPEALDVHTRAGLFPARADEYGADVRGRLEGAGSRTLADYLEGCRRREAIRAAFRRVFRACDVLLTPVNPKGAPPIGRDDGLRDLIMPHTTPQDLAGLPACSVRAGFDEDGLPLAVQLTGPPWCEARVVRAAQALFDATPELQARRPPNG